jgi:hypothetical protein
MGFQSFAVYFPLFVLPLHHAPPVPSMQAAGQNKAPQVVSCGAGGLYAGRIIPALFFGVHVLDFDFQI